MTHVLDKSGSCAANLVEEGGNDVVNDSTTHNVDNPPESVANEQGLSAANGAQRKQKHSNINHGVKVYAFKKLTNFILRVSFDR